MVRDSGEGGARRDNGCRNKDTGWGGTAFTEPGTYSSNGTRDLVMDFGSFNAPAFATGGPA